MIGETIKHHRTARGWSPRQLAAASGVSHQTIRNAESGKRSPRWETVEKLAKALDLSVADLAAQAG